MLRSAYASLVLAGLTVGCFGESTVTSGGNGGGGSAGSGGNAGSAGTGGGGTGGNVGGGGTGGISPPPECTMASECDTLFAGPPACGVWACNAAGLCEASSPGCTDADTDGYGTGPNCACAGLDCDDADDTVGDTATASCYSGPAGTAGVGSCQAGQASCSAGIWTPCVGEVTPSGEACNNQDDDCNGQADDNLGQFTCGIGACANSVQACSAGQVGACVPLAPMAPNDVLCDGIDNDCDGIVDEDCSCVRVSPIGNDITGNGAAIPFLTIQAAINFAVANPNGSQVVCVAGGLTCNNSNTYSNAMGQTVTMADGVSVVGSYEATGWTQCNNITTSIAPGTPEGVTFPAAVQSQTGIANFQINRLNAGTTAGITVDGAVGAVISNVRILASQAAVMLPANSYGVDVKNGADVLITKSVVDAGFGTTESMGVRAIGSLVNITGNCLSPDPVTGRCDDFCGGNPAIRGNNFAVGPQVPQLTHAIYLEDSPGSIIESSALCANTATVGSVVKITGDATNVIFKGNTVNAFGGVNESYGVWLEECGGAAPWIVNNQYITSAGTSQMTSVDGVRAMGDCHPVVDSNVQITGGGEGNASNPNGVHCGLGSSGVSSSCVVLNNQNIEGSDFGFPPIATGVRCDNGACNRVANNVITGRGGITSYGVVLDNTGAVVDSNQIRGGCSGTATGLWANDVWSRIQNNTIVGFSGNDCVGGLGGNLQLSRGMQVLVGAGLNEIDVHSNTIDGTGVFNAGAPACTSYGLELDVSAMPPASGVGIFRNNIILAGQCGTLRYNVRETGADPRIFENNDLAPNFVPTGLYFDENMNLLTMTSQVDGLLDMTVSGTMSLDPLFVMYPANLHLTGASPCIDAGTVVGAPLKDIDGITRDAMPDIGADEF